MRKLLNVLMLIACSASMAWSTHILGGEITYVHVENNQYRFYIDLYRDCSECLLAGKGGGSSTKDCGTFSVYLRSSDVRECTPTELASFTPSFENYRSILPTCNTVKTACDPNPNFGYGAEIHRYSVLIDFDNYLTSSDCGFEVYIKMSSRSDQLDNVNEEEALFYNYAYIDPFAIHDSPILLKEAKVLLSANQSQDYRIAQKSNSLDSISFELATPLRDRNKPLTYKSGYSVSRPLSVNCAGDATCKPDPLMKPAKGYFVQSNIGRVVYTPINSGEQAAIAYEIKQFAKYKGNYRLQSIVRRDIQQIVISDINEAPIVFTEHSGAKNDYFEVCEGDKLCFNISATDNSVSLPDGSKSAQDTVNFNWVFNGTGASITQVADAAAPYNKVRFCWEPTASDVNDESYELVVFGTDNHCPLMAQSARTIRVRVLPRPNLQILSSKLECGHLVLRGNSTDGQKLNLFDWKVIDGNSQLVTTRNKQFDTVRLQQVGWYTILLSARNELGCSKTVNKVVELKGEEIQGPPLFIDGLLNLCDEANLTLKSGVSETYTIMKTEWLLESTSISTDKDLSYAIQLLNDGNHLKLQIQSKRNGLVCNSVLDTVVRVDPFPLISVQEDLSICPEGQVVDLRNYVTPNNGSFNSATVALADGHLIETAKMENRNLGNAHCFDYSMKSDRGFCENTRKFCIDFKAIPELVMKDLTVCSYTGNFLLNNLLLKPYTFNGLTIKWELNGVSINVPNVNNQYWLDLTGLANGKHKIACVVTNSFGCSTRDSAELELLDEVSISMFEPVYQCQGNSIQLSDLFNVYPKGGHWTSKTNANELDQNVLKSSACGDSISLSYTYDQFGCYDSKTVYLKVICKPAFEINISGDTLCSKQLVELKSSLEGGVWSGNGVFGNTLQSPALAGNYSVKYTVAVSNCMFDKQSNYTVVNPAIFALDALAEGICEGDELTLNNIFIKGGNVDLNINGKSFNLNEQTNNFRFKPDVSANSLTLNWTIHTKSANCPSYRTDEISIYPLPIVALDRDTFSGCEALIFTPNWFGSEKIKDWSGVNFSWNVDANDPFSSTILGQKPKLEYKKSGLYALQLSTESTYGCEWKSSVKTVRVYDQPEAYFVLRPGSFLPIGNTVMTFTNSSTCEDTMLFTWDFGVNNGYRYSTKENPKFIYPSDTATYQAILTVESKYGCIDQFERSIEVGPDVTIYVPNAFTPNSEGPSSTESHRVVALNVKEYEIFVYSRTGEIVYWSTDINGSWDGTYKGLPCQTGIYMYQIWAKSHTNLEYNLSGAINLIR
jgi:gliding motility-associated-like protein